MLHDQLEIDMIIMHNKMDQADLLGRLIIFSTFNNDTVN